VRLWHVTDPHLGRPGGRGAEAIRAVVAAMLAPGAERDMLLLTGDLGDLALLRELLAPIRGRVLCCIGNHDQSEPGPLEGVTFSAATERRFKEFAHWLDSPRHGTMLVIPGTRWLAVLLDSCAKTEGCEDLARGHIGGEQLGYLSEAVRVSQAHALQLLIGLHHDVADADPTMTLEDGGELLALAWPTASLVLSGHTHGPACEWTSTEGVRGLWRRGQDAVGGGAGAVWSVDLS